MPNTIRTQQELLNLLPDNTEGLITAQNLRDFVVTAFSPSAIELNSTIATSFNADGSIVETYSDNSVVTTTFTSNSIVQSYGAPFGKTKTTTFNSDGTISEVIS